MTVNYNSDFSTSNATSLCRMIKRWKGSMWKAVFKELTGWLVLYAILQTVYRWALDNEQKKAFNHVAKYCADRMNYVPLSFMLGFFVSNVIARWTTILSNIGIIDNVALVVATHVQGTTEKARLLRRTIVRYCVLAQTIAFRDMSLQVKKRFPTWDTVVAAGFMLEQERDLVTELKGRHGITWLPFQWAMALANEAHHQGKIKNDFAHESVVEEIKLFRIKIATLCDLDRVPIPLVYPQLVFIAVNVYFMVALVARQSLVEFGKDDLDPTASRHGFYFPWMAVFEFVVYYAWMTVAMALLNPLGEDDDDFETNWLIDRNLAIGFDIVDKAYDSVPELEKDEFYDKEVRPLYSEESAALPREFLHESAVDEAVIPIGRSSIRMVAINPDGTETEAKIVAITKEDVAEQQASSPNVLRHRLSTRARDVEEGQATTYTNSIDLGEEDEKDNEHRT